MGLCRRIVRREDDYFVCFIVEIFGFYGYGVFWFTELVGRRVVFDFILVGFEVWMFNDILLFFLRGYCEDVIKIEERVLGVVKCCFSGKIRFRF